MESLKTVGAVGYLLVILTMVVGWFMNIFDLVAMAGGAIDTMFVLRVIGIFVAPLGAILGLFF